MRTKADSPTKNCTHEGCTKALRARGLCGSHYNQAHQPNRHAKTITHCTVCNKVIERAYRANRRPTCSPECRHALSGQQYTRTYNFADSSAERARLHGVTIIEHFTNTEVFERDNYTCYMCGIQVDPAADCYQPNSATVDHVIPFAANGPHTLANARCACFQCNSTKQAKVLDA